MAIIQIPVGGQAVGVEVPDFAMDVTLRELINEIRQQTASVTAGLSTLNSTSADARRTDAANENSRNASLLSHLNKVGQYIQNTVPGARFATQAVSSAANSVNVLADSNKLSAALESGLLTQIPLVGRYLSGFGEALATPVKIMEQMSQSLDNFIRVGGSASVSMIEMKNSAASIGLELNDFSTLVGDSGKTIAALGGNTTEGSRRLLDMIATLRRTTQDIGYLGMSSSDMAQYMVDEIEARRRLSNTIDLQTMDAAQLSAVLKERYTNELAVARLTGQDVRDRMEAQMNYQMSVSGAGVIASLQNQDQRAAVDAAIGSFTQFGANQALVEEMFNRQMMFGSAFAGLSDEMSAQASIMMGLGVDLQSFVAQQADASRSGNVEMVQALTNQFADEIKMMSGSGNQQMLTKLTMLGVQGAEAGAEMILGTITANANAIGSYTDQIIAQREQIYADMKKGLYQFAALSTVYEGVHAKAIALRDQGYLQLFGVNAANEQTAGAALVAGLSTATVGIETAKTALDAVATAQAALTQEIKSTLGIEGTVTGLITSMENTMNGLNDTVLGLQAYLSSVRTESRN